MSDPLFQITPRSSDREIIVTMPDGRVWSCEYPSLNAEFLRPFLEKQPQRFLVWFACDCAERQHGRTRDREEMEVMITTTARRWVAGMVGAEACDFPLDETVESTKASWHAAQVVVARDAPAFEYAERAARLVQLWKVEPGELDAGRRESEGLWQTVRLAVLASLEREVWDDVTPFQAALDMSEEQVRPWSETFLELMGVPEPAWNPPGT